MNPADVCGVCGSEWDDHRLRIFRRHWALDRPGMNLPFEQIPGGPVERPVEQSAWADHVTVAAAAVPVPEEARRGGLPAALPALVFDFSRGTAPVCSTVLVLDEPQLSSFRDLVSDAVDAARLGAADRSEGAGQ